MFTRRFIPKHIHSVLISGPFHPHYGGPPGGTTGARISSFHLLTNQEGNLRGVRRCVYRLRRSRDVVGPLVPPEQHTPPDPSDMSNLEFRVQTNLGKRGMPYGCVPPRFRGADGGHWGTARARIRFSICSQIKKEISAACVDVARTLIVATLLTLLSARRLNHPPTHPTCQTSSSRSKSTCQQVWIAILVFHPLCG